MVKILNYMFEKELRPVELLRSMDKTVSFKLTREEFLRRCVVSQVSIVRMIVSHHIKNIEPNDSCIPSMVANNDLI